MAVKIKDKLKNINKYHILILCIMLFSAVLLVYLTSLKVGMHLDEYLTYGLANHEADGANKIKPEFGVRLAAEDVFDVFFYPDDFSIKNVWLNQGCNVHPPFYYLIFHIFTLVTRCFLGLKTGVLLNIVFHMINIALIRLIIKEMLDNEYEALLGAFLYAFMPSILGNVLFIRMYMLMSTYLLALTLLFIRGWKSRERKTFYIKLGIISVCGTLTHYYFLIYLFFCCLVWGISILCKRRWKELAVFVGTMAVSSGACIAIFPYILGHLFTGAAGERTIKNLLSPAFLKNIGKFIGAIDNVYGGFLLAVAIAGAALLVFSGIIWKKEDKNSVSRSNTDVGFDETDMGGRAYDAGLWLMLLVPCVFYFLTVTWLAIAAAARYISPIYPVCLLLLVMLFEKLASYALSNDKAKCVACILLVAITLNNSWKNYEWPELHLDAEECINTARKYGVNNECIYVLNVTWHSFPTYQEFIQYQNMTFIRDSELELLFNDDYAQYDHVVMYFDNYVNQESVDEILDKMVEMNPGLDGYEMLHKYTYNTAYYLD